MLAEVPRYNSQCKGNTGNTGTYSVMAKCRLWQTIGQITGLLKKIAFDKRDQRQGVSRLRDLRQHQSQ